MNEQTENTIINVLIQVDRNSQIMAGVAPTPLKRVGLDLSKLTDRQRRALTFSLKENDASLHAIRKGWQHPDANVAVFFHPADEAAIVASLDEWASVLEAQDAEKSARIAAEEAKMVAQIAENRKLLEIGREELPKIYEDIIADAEKHLDCFNNFKSILLEGAVHSDPDNPQDNNISICLRECHLPQKVRDALGRAVAERKMAVEARSRARKAQLDAVAAEAPGLLGERWVAGLASEGEVLDELRRHELEKMGFEHAENSEWNDWDKMVTVKDATFALIKEIEAKLPEGADTSIRLMHRDQSDDDGGSTMTNRAIVLHVRWLVGVIPLEADILVKSLPDR
ncbi:hypothetical protein EBZ80_15840 [bacterium]|nr:hypothetical protein [bacterium]